MKLLGAFPIGCSSKYPSFFIPPPTGISSTATDGIGGSATYVLTGAFVAFFAAFLTAGLGACPYSGYSDISIFLPPPIGCSSKVFLFPPIGCSSNAFFLPPPMGCSSKLLAFFPPIGCSSKLFLFPPTGTSSTFLTDTFLPSYFGCSPCYYLLSYFFIRSANFAGGFLVVFFGCYPSYGNYEKSNFLPPIGMSSGLTYGFFLFSYGWGAFDAYVCYVFKFYA